MAESLLTCSYCGSQLVEMNVFKRGKIQVCENADCRRDEYGEVVKI